MPIKKLLLAAAVGLASLAGSSLVDINDAAASGSAGCVTRAEFSRVDRGMVRGRIDRIFETAGYRTVARTGNTYRRLYKHCDPSLRVEVTYNADTSRMISKALDTPGCVSRDEMAQVVPWQTTISQAHKIFDTTGHLTGANFYTYIRQYGPCVLPSTRQVVEVEFSSTDGEIYEIGWADPKPWAD